MRRRVNGAAAPAPRPSALRCAIYTRKSTEEGLDQDFNSLDAQREAAEAFVQSQRGEGWEIVPDRYDDGGYSGGNTDRPALRRLMDDIDAGRVNVVVVYKVDRLSRSLLDFAKIMERFDARQVAFVSVTQQFNTATSMGRLVLHILLSFAQFEREMIAERTRDKMSAARKKGKWVGGTPILGYDVDPRGGKLVVNEAEAARVREIFGLYLKEQSLLGTAIELNNRGWTTKSWTTKKGRVHAGGPFTKPNVFGLLTNVAYTGQVHYRGTLYPGEHAAIVDPDVWRRAQDLLRHNARTGGRTQRNKHGALLKELLRCAPCDAAMVATYTTSGTKRYRYYVCNKAQKQGWTSCPTRAVPAHEIERYMVEQIRAIATDPAVLKATIDGTRVRLGEAASALETERLAAESDQRGLHAQMRKLLDRPASTEALADVQDKLRANERRLTGIRERAIAAGRDRVDEADVAAALSHFDPVWDELFPREQARILRVLLRSVRYDGASGSLNFTFRPAGIKALAEEAVADRAEALR
jgi:site-specific DNA recombinase